jgi:hypothetical protein
LIALRGDLLLPYPKPLTLKSGSFEALLHLRPVLDESLMADEWYVRPQDIRPDAVDSPRHLMAVVVPIYTVGVSTTLTPLSHTDAFLALVINSVNLDHHGSEGAAVLGRIAEQIPCFELRYSDTLSACKSFMEVASLTTQRAS